MGFSFIDGCLRASNVQAQGQNYQAILTSMFGEAEQLIVKLCIEDPNLDPKKVGYMNMVQACIYRLTLGDLVNGKYVPLDDTKRQNVIQEMQKWNALVQATQQKHQQVQGQWDAIVQVASTGSNTAATNQQQLLSQLQSIIQSMGTLTSLMQSM